MVNVVGSRDNYDRWKPDELANHKTIQEVADIVKRSTDRIKQLEKKGVLPKPIRVKVGRLQVRLYSPSEVEKIEQHFKNPERQKHAAKKKRRTSKF